MTVHVITPPLGPIAGTANPPGSKSHTIRALFLAASAQGDSTIGGALESDDTAHARQCLRSLGIDVLEEGDTWTVRGSGGHFRTPSSPLDAGESGLTARFVIALSALVDGEVTVTGRGRLPLRPMSSLIEPLRAFGVDVSTRYPWTVSGKGFVDGGEVAVDGSVSSQAVSALLLLAPLARRGMIIEVSGSASSSYLDITAELMRTFGADPVSRGNIWTVGPTGYQATSVAIPMDASAMVYPAAAAAISGGVVEVRGDPGFHPDLAFLPAIESMGCEVVRTADRITVKGPATLRGLSIDMSEAPDAAVALAVLCAAAQGSSRIDGLSTLRLKESDRLAALRDELSKVGTGVTIDGDSLLIEPGGDIVPANLNSHEDHRLAMSFSLLGLVANGVSIEGGESVKKTWPGYWEWFSSLGAIVTRY